MCACVCLLQAGEEFYPEGMVVSMCVCAHGHVEGRV